MRAALLLAACLALASAAPHTPHRKLLQADGAPDQAAPWGRDWGIGFGRDIGFEGGFRRLRGVVTDTASGPVSTAAGIASSFGAPFNAGAVQGYLNTADKFAAPFVG